MAGAPAGPREAQKGTDSPREPQSSPERFKEKRRHPERPREANRTGPESHREARLVCPERSTEPQRGSETPTEVHRDPDSPSDAQRDKTHAHHTHRPRETKNDLNPEDPRRPSEVLSEHSKPKPAIIVDTFVIRLMLSLGGIDNLNVSTAPREDPGVPQRSPKPQDGVGNLQWECSRWSFPAACLGKCCFRIQKDAKRPREAQRSPERPAEQALRGTERPDRSVQRGAERPREAKRHPARKKET